MKKEDKPQPQKPPLKPEDLKPEDWAKIEERGSKLFDLAKKVLEMSGEKPTKP